MKKVLITTIANKSPGAWEHQLGNAAILTATIEGLKAYISEIKIFTDIQLSDNFSHQHNIESLHYPVLWQTRRLNTFKSIIRLLTHIVIKFTNTIFGSHINPFSDSDKLHHYHEIDAILDLSADSYSSDAVNWLTILNHSLELLSARLLNIKVIVFAVSPGPFRPRLIQYLAKYTLNKMTIITVREKISVDLLLSIGVNKNKIIETACPAFLFKPVAKNEATALFKQEVININKNNKIPLFGFSLAGYNLYSYHTWTNPLSYKDLDTYATAIEYAINKINANIVLIPHVYRTNQWTGEAINGPDYVTLRNLYNNLKNNYGNRIYLLSKTYTSAQMKGIIGLLDLFITGRLHAGIGALSQNIPTVLIAYGHKHYGIAKLLEQENLVCTGTDAEEMKEKILYAWKNKREISDMLNQKMKTIIELANKNFTTVYNTILK